MTHMNERRSALGPFGRQEPFGRHGTHTLTHTHSASIHVYVQMTELYASTARLNSIGPLERNTLHSLSLSLSLLHSLSLSLPLFVLHSLTLSHSHFLSLTLFFVLFLCSFTLHDLGVLGVHAIT